MAAQDKSILDETKKVLGLEADYTAFDLDITMLINTAFFTLNQLGVGPETTYSIEDKDNLWSEFIGDRVDINAVKTYVAMKTRLVFDPPQLSSVQTSYEKIVEELGHRLMYAVEKSYIGNTSDLEIQNFWWEISDADSFPPEANIGDVGFDPISGNVWRKIK